jgi:hypothetical protein
MEHPSQTSMLVLGKDYRHHFPAFAAQLPPSVGRMKQREFGQIKSCGRQNTPVTVEYTTVRDDTYANTGDLQAIEFGQP